MTRSTLLAAVRNRYAAGRVVGHRNVRHCKRCRGWHHRDYHQPVQRGSAAVLGGLAGACGFAVVAYGVAVWWKGARG